MPYTSIAAASIAIVIHVGFFSPAEREAPRVTPAPRVMAMSPTRYPAGMGGPL